MRRMITGSIVLSVGLTSVVLVVPVFANPFAPSPHPVSTRAAEIRLGDVDRPAPGVRKVAGLAAGTALAPDAAARLSTAVAAAAKVGARSAAPAPRTITAREDSTADFSAIGVTWSDEPGVGAVSVSVRSRGASGTWSAWHSADAEEGKDTPSATTRGGAEMVWTGPARGVEVSVTAVTGQAPRDVRVELIDPGTSAADANPDGGAPRARAAAATPLLMPQILARSSWGANERQMSWPPSYAPSVKAITLHHTVNSNTYSAAQVPAMLRSIYHYHAVSHGWGDIGYNVIVDRFGRLWEGRAGGLTRSAIGAHAGGFNRSTAGISMLGDFSKASVPAVVQQSVARYAAWKLSLYGANPTGGTVLTGGPNTRYDHVVTVTVPTIFPHRLTSLTACPGSGGMQALPWIRTRTKQLMGAWALPRTIRPQLTTFDSTTGRWKLQNGANLQWGVGGDVAVPADYNGDSISDLAVFRPSTGYWWVRGKAATRWGAPGVGDVPVPGHYNSRSAVDKAVWRDSTGYWWIQGQLPVPYGQSGDTPVPADYDGDGQVGIAVFRPSTGAWWIRGQVPIVFGAPGDIPVPADYNGDGKTDIAVFRPSTGQWLIRHQGTFQWGVGGAGDVPVPHYYDNNRNADLAVWRSSTATWFVRNILSLRQGAPGHTPIPIG